jgi:hypothetical protein
MPSIQNRPRIEGRTQELQEFRSLRGKAMGNEDLQLELNGERRPYNRATRRKSTDHSATPELLQLLNS